MNHLSEQDLILLYYGEPDAPAQAREHLRVCPDCAREAETLRNVLEMADTLPIPEPRPALESELWSRMSPQLGTVQPRRRFLDWRWAAALGLAATLIALVVRSPEKLPSGLPDAARQRILTLSLADHLDRTQMLLTELENAPDAYSESFRSRAQDLIDEGRLMRQWLVQRGQNNTLAVVEEADRVLTEAVNTEDQPGGLNVLRARIGADSLLFRVRVVEANLRMEGPKS